LLTFGLAAEGLREDPRHRGLHVDRLSGKRRRPLGHLASGGEIARREQRVREQGGGAQGRGPVGGCRHPERFHGLGGRSREQQRLAAEDLPVRRQRTRLSGAAGCQGGFIQPSLGEQGSRHHQAAFGGRATRCHGFGVGRSPGGQQSARLNGGIFCANHSLREEDQHRCHRPEPEIHSTIRPLAPFAAAAQIAALAVVQGGEA